MTTTTVETFVDTPAGRLLVWATSSTHLGAATMRPDDKAHLTYRDNSQAQAAAESVTINRVAYDLRLHLYRADTLDPERIVAGRHGWAIDWHSVTLTRHGQPQRDGNHAAHYVREIVVPALADYAVSADGRALFATLHQQHTQERTQERTQVLTNDIQRLETELAQRRAELARLRG